MTQKKLHVKIQKLWLKWNKTTNTGIFCWDRPDFNKRVLVFGLKLLPLVSSTDHDRPSLSNSVSAVSQALPWEKTFWVWRFYLSEEKEKKKRLHLLCESSQMKDDLVWLEAVPRLSLWPLTSERPLSSVWVESRSDVDPDLSPWGSAPPPFKPRLEKILGIKVLGFPRTPQRSLYPSILRPVVQVEGGGIPSSIEEIDGRDQRGGTGA